MVTFMVVISSYLKASQECHGQHSGVWTGPCSQPLHGELLPVWVLTPFAP